MLLGCGSYGTVSLVDNYAVKNFNVRNSKLSKEEEYRSNFKYFSRELCYLSFFTGVPYFCQLVDYDIKEMTITMERYDGPLSKYIDIFNYTKRNFLAKTIIKQIDTALTFLHERGISHNDVSCGNILCNVNFDKNTIECYLADFSTTSIETKFRAHALKDLIYYDPDSSATNKESDIWALGATIIHFLSGSNRASTFRRDSSEMKDRGYIDYRICFPNMKIEAFTYNTLKHLLKYKAKERPHVETEINLKAKIIEKKKQCGDYLNYVEFVMVKNTQGKNLDFDDFKDYFNVVDIIDFIGQNLF